MKYLSLLLILLAGHVCAESTEALIQQLTVGVRAELNDPQNQKDSDFNRQNQILRSLVDIKVNNVDGKPRIGSADYFLSAVEQLGAATTSRTTQELCQTLGKQVRSEIAERQTTEVERIKKDMSAAIRNALAAKTSRDFDAPFTIARNALSDGEIVNSKDPSHTAIVQAVHNTWDFFRDLQDYVANLGHETTVISGNRWTNIVALHNDFSVFVPRSEVLASLEELHKRIGIPEGAKPMTQEEFDKKCQEIVATAKLLDDLEKADAQITAMMRTDETIGLRMNSQRQPLSTLREYVRTYAKVRSGIIDQSEISSIIVHQADLHHNGLLDLSNQLVLAAIPRLLQTEDKAKAGETPSSYLQRLSEQAVAAADWNLLARAIDLMPTVNPGSRQPIADRIATQAFLAGLNQERARQYALAVTYYQKALRSGSQLIKAELIGDRLEKLRKEHPEAFEQAQSSPSQTSDKNASATAPQGITRSSPPLFPDNSKGVYLFGPPSRTSAPPPAGTPNASPARQ